MQLLFLQIKKARVLLCLIVAGCTFDVPLEFNKPITRPEGVKSVSANMGIFYSPGFLSYEHKVTVGGGHKLIFRLGKASADHFSRVFPFVFQRTKFVNERPPLSKTSVKVEAVLEPAIDHVTIQDPALFGWAGTYDVRITYRFILFNMAGEPLASWTVSGAGRNAKGVSWSGLDNNVIAAEAARRAIEAAGDNFMQDFTKEPEVRRWLRGRQSARSLSLQPD